MKTFLYFCPSCRPHTGTKFVPTSAIRAKALTAGSFPVRDCLRHDVTEHPSPLPSDCLEAVILDDLLRRWGPLLQGDALRRALGFSTMTALRQAITRGTTPVPLFKIDGRRGRYALTWTVAHWLASHSADSCANIASKSTGGSHPDATSLATPAPEMKRPLFEQGPETP
mgnify:CR=1 FL=1